MEPLSLRRLSNRNSASLEGTLVLKDGATALVTLPAGNLEGFELEMALWGFSAWVAFVIDDDKAFGGGLEDKLLPVFTTHKLLTAELTIWSRSARLASDAKVDPIKVVGLVEQKQLREVVTTWLGGRPCLQRFYQITFRDPLSVLWQQHYPLQLYVKKAFSDVLTEHLIKPVPGPAITLKQTLPALKVVKQVLLVGLGLPEASASFYDLVVWFCDHMCGHLLFDPVTGGYEITDKRIAPTEFKHLHFDVVHQLEWSIEPPRRHNGEIVNVSAVSNATRPVKVADSVIGLRRDYLIRSDVAKDLGDTTTRQTTRMAQPLQWCRVSLKEWPQVGISPGMGLTLKGGLWNTELTAVKYDHRIFRTSISARRHMTETQVDRYEAFADFELEVELALEPSDCAVQRLPDYTRPHYPVRAEGKVVSLVGAPPELTFQHTQHPDTRAMVYEVEMPIFKNQKILAPFDPQFMSGHFFFPAYKNERVLISFDFDRAWIKRFLDWKPGAQLTDQTQGNHLLMGWTERNRTSFKHIYESRRPVFSIERRNDRDTGVMRIFEGTMVLRIEEEKVGG